MTWCVVQERYERHHQCIFDEDALTAAVTLSARYIPDRYLPDKAIDAMDEAASRVRIQTYEARRAAVVGRLHVLEWENLVQVLDAKDEAVQVCCLITCCLPLPPHWPLFHPKSKLPSQLQSKSHSLHVFLLFVADGHQKMAFYITFIPNGNLQPEVAQLHLGCPAVATIILCMCSRVATLRRLKSAESASCS